MNLQTLQSNYGPRIHALASRHKAENIRVFGSVARGDATADSDVDILVHFMPGASYFDWVGLEEDLSALLGLPVDVLSDRAIRDELAPYILSEAKPL